MRKCAILFLIFLTVLVFAALVENNQNQKDELEDMTTQELTLLDKK
ncbi:hypothetical protein [Allomuricauda sp. d1]